MELINALGRRKAAVARVYVKSGNGNITINGKELAAYFPQATLQFIVKQPLELTGTADREAYRSQLKAAGFLTRDSREVERKKPGQPGARRRFQFSKR